MFLRKIIVFPVADGNGRSRPTIGVVGRALDFTLDGGNVSDITKCNGQMCKKKWTCYRFLAPANPLQQYWIESPFQSGAEKCDLFWAIEKPKKALSEK